MERNKPLKRGAHRGRHGTELERVVSQSVNRAMLLLKQDLVRELGGLAETFSTQRIPRNSTGRSPAVHRHRFNGRFVISLTGQIEWRKSNIVFIEDAEVILPDADYALFLRLVVGLFETEDGFVDLGGTFPSQEEDGGEALFPEGLDQAVHRLRVRLGPALMGMRATDYVQVRRRRVRLSTHRKHVVFDRPRMLQHPDARIRRLAARLPAEIKTPPGPQAPE